jgi:hypothetical protein
LLIPVFFVRLGVLENAGHRHGGLGGATCFATATDVGLLDADAGIVMHGISDFFFVTGRFTPTTLAGEQSKARPGLLSATVLIDSLLSDGLDAYKPGGRHNWQTIC